MNSFTALATILVLVQLSFAFSVCPGTQIGKTCYKFKYRYESLPMTYFHASQACKSKGGQLVTVQNYALNDYLFRTFRKGSARNIWIGVSRKDAGYSWVYPDGKTVRYTKWNTGEPNDVGGNEDCAEMFDISYWNDAPCSHTNPSICEIPVQDIDECALGTDKCDFHATCTNTYGSYTCDCKPGFTGNGKSCADINECSASKNNNCHLLATCTNTIGSYTCTCPFRYTGDGKISCKKPAVVFSSAHTKILQELGKHEKKLTNIEQLLQRLLGKPLPTKKPALAGK